MDQPSEPSEPEAAELPATAHTVLGILSLLDEELSAAEIKVRCDYTLRPFYWSPAVSHIRRELRRLCELGLVTEREVSLGQVRKSMLYQTTERGEEVLRQWVSNLPLGDPVIVKDPVLLRIKFGKSTAPYDLVKILDGRLAQIEERIEDLVWSRRRAHELGLEQEQGSRYGAAITEYLLRAAHFDYGNIQQLRARIADFDPDHPELKISRPEGSARLRGREDTDETGR